VKLGNHVNLQNVNVKSNNYNNVSLILVIASLFAVKYVNNASPNNCLSKGILSRQRIKHYDFVRVYIFPVLGRQHHPLLFEWNLINKLCP